MQRAMEWIAVRGLGRDAHTHWFFGSRMVHTHEEDGEAISTEAFSLPGWTVVEGELSTVRTNQQEGSDQALGGLDTSLEAFSVKVEPAPVWWKQLSLFHIVRPLLVGIVHGLAGSAAVALLVLATINRASWAIGYLLIFGLGTVAGMMLITAAIAIPFAYSMRNFVRLNRGLALASGFLSLAFGLFLCYQIGFVDGLFTGHAKWIPR